MSKGSKAMLMLIGSIMTAVLLLAWPYGAQTEVDTAVIQSGDLIQTVLLNGMVTHVQEQRYVAMRDGTISDIYVVPGQTIHKGDLLIKIDATEEEKALAQIYEAKFLQNIALKKMTDSAANVIQNELALSQQETRLRTSIELSYLRAQADGEMSAVYVQKGQRIYGSTLMGISYAEGIQIVAETSGFTMFNIGSKAVARNGSKEITLLLKEISAAEESGKQLLVFEVIEEARIQEFRAGETVSIELTIDVQPEKALFPLSAVDSNEMVWFVEDQKVFHQKMTFDEMNREFAASDAKWAGKQVILQPDRYDLQDGMEVRVKK